MSPRKTRRGAKSEGVNNTLSETIAINETAESSPENQPRIRTRRQSTKASTLESASKAMNKSRGTRARKKPAKKADKSSDDEPAVAAAPPPPPSAASTRRRINASAAANVTIIDAGIDSTTMEDTAPMSDEDTEVLQVSTRISRLKAAAAAAAASPAPRSRRARSAKHRLEDFTPESSPITVNLTPHRTTKTPRKSPMNLGSPKSHADAPLRLAKTPRKLPVVVESPAPSEMSVTSSTHSTPEKQEAAAPSTPAPQINDSKKPRRKSPKSSPEKKSSPRRSPGKTVAAGKFSRSPKSSPEKKSPRRSPAKKSAAVGKFSKSPKIVLRSPKPKSPKSKTPRVAASKLRRPSLPKRPSRSPRGGKTPRSPNPAAPTSPRRTSGAAAASPSPEKAGGELASPRRSTKVSGSPLSSPSLMSLQLARVDSPKSPRETRLAGAAAESVAHSPTVILSKISPSGAGDTVETVTRSSARRTPVDSAKSTPIRSPNAEKRSSQGGESPHRAKSTIKKKRSAITDSGTPLRPIDSPLSSAKLTAAKSMILSSSNTPVDIARTKAEGDAARLLSSTPRERIRRSLNLSPGLGVTSEVGSPVNGEVPAGSSTMILEGRSRRRSFRIDDESNPLISEDDESISPRAATTRLDGTFEVEKDRDATVVAENEREKSGDGTYDLAEPKTPNLRRKAAKRALGETDDSVEEQRAVKRTCRVRFASPTANEAEKPEAISAPVSRSRSATPGHRAGAARTPQNNLGGSGISGLRDAKTEEGENKSRRRSNSVSGASLLKTPVGAKRRSNSVSDAGARSASRRAQNASVNRLSKPRLSISSAKKPEAKTPVARKAPNFAQIHQKNFSQMESLVDAKKRVEKRHIAMNSKIPTNVPRVNSKVAVKPAVSSQPIAPVVAVNGAYNRYGFKLRKDDATKLVAQKQQTRTSQKKTNENRQLLKGVRTNRRFDLIMKARNINI